MKKSALRLSVFTFSIIVFFLCLGCGQEKIDNRAQLSVLSSPDGAKITVNQKEIGITPITSLKVNPGTYIIEISKSSYKSAWKRVICPAKSQKNIEVRLIPVTASVMIESTPSGAIVSREGNQIGQTPVIIHGQTVGRHTASVSRPGFVSQEISWDIENARPQLIRVDLASNIGTLSIKSEPSEANLYINDKPRGQTPFSEEIEEGEFNIRVEKSGYAIHEEAVVLARGKQKEINVRLQILPGTLTVKSIPVGASLFLDDLQCENTPATITDLSSGTYKVRCELRGYDSGTRDVTVSPGQHTEVTIQLDSNLGGLDLLVNPPGVTVYVDGEKKGITQPSDEPFISKVFEIYGLTSGEHTVTLSHSRAVPPKKTLKFQVKKGQITRPNPITLWVADSFLKLKDGRQMIGRIHHENPEDVLFEPEPSVRQRYRRDEIEVLRGLEENE